MRALFAAARRYIALTAATLIYEEIMQMSEMQLTKRQLLGGVAVATASLAVFSSANAAVEIPKPDGDVDMAAVLKPGSLPEMVIGKDDAKVTIVEYMSMTCPHCANFHNKTFDEIKKKYVDTGKARFIIREFPFDPRSAAAFMLARCNPSKPEDMSTADQYFPMVSMLFKQQQTWVAAQDGRAALLQMSKLAGFSEDSFTKCLTNQKLLDEVNATRERGSKEFGVNATPTFLINGKRYSGDMSVDIMSALIDSML